ncbi:hypothetical protein L484_018960 [Morus notabilis]|uniref:Transposase-associated domain-containing protein n=1 Tax=Morus notabilis TaxID=981085 RepID=W9RJF6_9ROSA|nr:hypothetical protein L484_018960 [Morus notabilis]
MAFLEMAKNHVNEKGQIRYPCNNCVNYFWHTLEEVDAHIIRKGFDPFYDVWMYHGEAEADIRVDEKKDREEQHNNVNPKKSVLGFDSFGLYIHNEYYERFRAARWSLLIHKHK